MANLELDLELVTPLFLGGANARSAPELRASPLRGVLRYWLRAMLGAGGILDKDSLHTAESRVLGDTRAGSSVTVRISGANGREPEQGNRRVLPHSGEKTFSSPAFLETEAVRLNLITRPTELTWPKDALAALLLWLYLGGLGKRARRGFGSLRVAALRVVAGELPDDIPAGFRSPALSANGTALANEVREALAWVLQDARASSGRPPFPAFVPGQSQVLVCTQPFSAGNPAYEPAMKHFWVDQLRNRSKGLLHDEAYGYARPQGRRASPIHLHIARSEQGYHLILTALYSEPSPAGEAGWDKVAKLVDSCAKDWHGEYVWGDGK